MSLSSSSSPSSLSSPSKEKQGEDFKINSKKYGIKRWNIHQCSFCDYDCGYVFDHEKEKVYYDSGCNCILINISSSYRETTWDDVAEHYHMNEKCEDIKKQYDMFWHFYH